MKIERSIEFRGKEYAFLSDDSREAQSDEAVLFVETSRNVLFAEQMRKEGRDILHYRDLKEYFTFPAQIIGITGTNGKTTTANLIYHVLLKNGKKCAMLGTQGLFFGGKQIKPKGLTTPGILELYEDLALLHELGCEVLVMEVSSHAISQDRIFGLDFAAKILTNITSDHLDYHKTLASYIATKNAFLSDGGLKIINKDEENANFSPKNTKSYGVKNPCDLQAKNFDKNHATLQYQGREYMLKMPLYGLHNLYNIMACVLCVRELFGLEMEQILSSLQDFGGVSGRMEVVCQNPMVIVDFAHTHDGIEKILQGFLGQSLSVVFGAGGDRDRSKRPLMGEVVRKYAKKIYVTSDNPRSEDPMSIIRDILEGIEDREGVVVLPDRYEAIKKALDHQEPGEILFVLGKGDETHQILVDRVVDFDDRMVIRELLSCRLV
ncbi:UDP-N-acetylmuramoylalanyl-D-glutamate--2,6-dia mi ligase [Helicobacter mustelae]|uniref:UDP-N-acetylmuramoyl-L-alanyl-D-glutamate--2, 6-diaminopimelate ligase n=1 Tax=Helicobacter mustelae TaxID=217 RepID=UPI000DFDF99F|nr:UDP-N-acetylmuramoyl-L-alanyl-D-glutamate--2,6-diaminopimelate ligase [Helicobacter mustelae]STP12537.1 UDP-N-acetylmuramoylalanyl-D-glutamate--2,6-dia mi ligase [Helicobacter mustelae]